MALLESNRFKNTVNVVLTKIPCLYINNNLGLWNLRKKRSYESYTLRRFKKILNDDEKDFTLEQAAEILDFLQKITEDK